MTCWPKREGAAADRGGQDLDAPHGSCRAGWADMERAPSQSLVAVVRVGQQGEHRRQGRRGVEELAAAGQLGLAAMVAEQSIVADALEAVGQDMQQEASDELVRVEGHDLAATVVPVVLPAEGDGAVPDLGQAGVGDGDAVGVAAEVVEHLLWPAEGRLGIDDPVDAARRLQLLGKASGLVEVDEGSAEDQLACPESLVEGFEEQTAEQAGQHAGRQEEAGRQATQRWPSGARPPPGTMPCRWGWCCRVWPQVCSTATKPISAPR